MKNWILRLLAACMFWLAVPGLQAQPTFPYNGVADQRQDLYAFINATIYQDYQTLLENAVLIIRKGKVEAIGQGIAIPPGAVIVDAKGKTIYPSFIDLYSSYGMPEPKAVGKRPEQQPQMLSNKKGPYGWNEALKPEFRAHEHFSSDKKSAASYRESGFGTVLVHSMDGISRGTSVLVAPNDQRENLSVIKQLGAHHLSFRKGTSTQNYPSSLMGAIALIRQTYYDAEWYQNGGSEKELNLSLQAWNELADLPQIFDVRDQLEALRAGEIAKEFDLNYILKGNGDEYKRLEEIKTLGFPLIIPLLFPDAYDVEDPYAALSVSLSDMMHWEQAPANLSRLSEAGIPIALTTHGLKSKKDFWKNLRKAIQYGFSEEDALKALTYTPAQLIGAYDQVGSLEKGKVASFIIVSKNIFEEDAAIHHHWVNGQPYVLKPLEVTDLSGRYELKAGNTAYDLQVEGEAGNHKMEIQLNDSTTIKVKNSLEEGLIQLSFAPDAISGNIRLSGVVTAEKWSGRGQLADGNWIDWMASPKKAAEKEEVKEEKEKEESTPEVGAVPYPFMAYGWTEKPAPETVLIKNATVWTNEEEGILENTDVLLRDGKIAKIGSGLSARGATEIDGTNKHVTAGIIDEHSHIAISRGVNEGTQSSSAEVSIGDVVNSEDINIYRQLSGGVTTSQLLHGSANPIGGQSAIIKLRWGYSPEEMKFEGADGFIKFALGENVKQSNWGDNNTTRFPQTRMGVEQVYDNYFTEARKYGEKKASGEPYRKDLEMEALLEILNKERFITCHSYRQSEINMLMKVAERYGFRVNTFTHILEGYKIADIMAEHGAGGSSFSDWWAYKFEVYDAIPHNGALMHEQGVTVAFNSDDAEMARRLNQEAAKAVKYGGVSEEDALKFVTLNPAKLLHIDDRVGSIRVGKDADVVLWSDHPLSVYARAEMTFIDGIRFFDRQRDLELRDQVRKERARLVQKMLDVKNGGGKTQGVKSPREFHYHCDTMEEEIRD
jgi:imidazolonepropionase-like amidohydrolase